MSKLISKLMLGTAQFGLDYGINNLRGKIPFNEIEEILDMAIESNIDFIDTAVDYADAETILGNIISKKNHNFKISSKLPSTSDHKKVRPTVLQSLECLKTDSLYAYLIHDFNNYIENPRIYDELLKCKDDNKIVHTGFSVYYPYELELLVDRNTNFDIVQLPFNIFDRRFEYLLTTLKDNNIEIHVRSVFLQGLFFKKIEELSSHFATVTHKLEQLQNLAMQHSIPLNSMLLAYVYYNENIDKLVIGIDSKTDLINNINANASIEKTNEILYKLDSFAEDNPEILLPFNWN